MIQIVKKSACEDCGVTPKCKCKLKVYKIEGQNKTLCLDCFMKYVY